MGVANQDLAKLVFPTCTLLAHGVMLPPAFFGGPVARVAVALVQGYILFLALGHLAVL